MGLRSVYAKTVRDSRRAALVVGLVAGAFMFGTGAPYGAAPEFSTIELRQQFIAGLTALPLALRGLLGEPIHVETLGGFLSWRIGNTLVAIFGLWSVIALSGTLAGEASKGSLDLIAAGPSSRARIAFQKVAGHVTAVAFAMLLGSLITWYVGFAYAILPGDEIPITAADRGGFALRLTVLRDHQLLQPASSVVAIASVASRRISMCGPRLACTWANCKIARPQRRLTAYRGDHSLARSTHKGDSCDSFWWRS
jgi:hypothetical protein